MGINIAISLFQREHIAILNLGLDKTKELLWAQNDLFEASQSLQKAMKTIKEIVDKP